MKLVLASDHGGYDLKEEIKKHLEGKGYEIEDIGTYNKDSVDYPKYGRAAAEMVAAGKADKGILCCGTGIGISLAANKVKGIRCAVVSDTFSAKMSRAHNDANMLSLGGRVVPPLRNAAFLLQGFCEPLQCFRAEPLRQIKLVQHTLP